MQLTRYCDYALRVLMYVGTKGADGSATISEISDFYGISRNHLMKVVHGLGRLGFIKTSRGKYGGLRLAKSPDQMTIGEIVRQTETNFDIVECFNEATNECCLTPICKLKGVLRDARSQFLQELDRYTLADAIADPVGPDAFSLRRVALGASRAS